MTETRFKHEPLNAVRRFYKAATVEPREGGWAVLLDGREARTPEKAPLRLPTEALARLVAAEWEAQPESIEFARMPATRLAFTAIDRAPAAREGLAGEVARYAGSDLLCYFAEGPQALIDRETAAWSPLLDWAEAELGLRFNRAAGIIHCAQPPETVAAVGRLAAELDDPALSALAYAAPLLGSAVLALALHRGRLSGEAAFDLSRIDEAYQEEFWGVDAEAAERTAGLRAEAVMLDRWFAALRPDGQGSAAR
jgi:chaperone required for assembly of F1-ATPase